jgi:hypothetical protein
MRRRLFSHDGAQAQPILPHIVSYRWRYLAHENIATAGARGVVGESRLIFVRLERFVVFDNVLLVIELGLWLVGLRDVVGLIGLWLVGLIDLWLVGLIGL